MERRQIGATPAFGRVGLVTVERKMAERARRDHAVGIRVYGVTELVGAPPLLEIGGGTAAVADEGHPGRRPSAFVPARARIAQGALFGRHGVARCSGHSDRPGDVGPVPALVRASEETGRAV